MFCKSRVQTTCFEYVRIADAYTRMRIRAIWPENDHVLYLQAPNIVCAIVPSKPRMRMRTRAVWPEHDHVSTGSKYCLCDHAVQTQNAHAHTRSMAREWPCVVSTGSKYCLYESCSPRTDCTRANCAYAIWSLPAKFVYAMRHVLSRRGSE